jgi:hypothetical protein
MLFLESTRPVTPILSVATPEGVDAGTHSVVSTKAAVPTAVTFFLPLTRPEEKDGGVTNTTLVQVAHQNQ